MDPAKIPYRIVECEHRIKELERKITDRKHTITALANEVNNEISSVLLKRKRMIELEDEILAYENHINYLVDSEATPIKLDENRHIEC